MSQRPIMDAGPGINFFSLNKERLLFSVLGALSVPEIVEIEILRKARQEERFAAAERVWKKLPPRLMEVLSDDVTEELALAVQRITMMPMEERVRMPRDLGETMVIAHAVVAAERGEAVIVLIDDGGGRRMVEVERRRLERRRATSPGLGRIQLISTVTVLKQAAEKKFIPDKTSMRDLYARLRTLDDGRPPLETTGLMDSPCWRVQGASC